MSNDDFQTLEGDSLATVTGGGMFDSITGMFGAGGGSKDNKPPPATFAKDGYVGSPNLLAPSGGAQRGTPLYSKIFGGPDR
jgi:hypothetical protein